MLFIAPALFTTNVIFGKLLVTVEPFTLAFLRWFFSSLILLMFCRSDWNSILGVFRQNVALSMLSGFLAFWVCGGMVYFALHHTSAANGTLIYTTPPVLILTIEAILRGRKISPLEIVGVAVAILGALTIILRGNAANLAALDFNTGDLTFVAAAISWAIYSVILKSPRFSSLSTTPLLTLFALCGTVILFPFALFEFGSTGNFPTSIFEWVIIAAIILFSSIFSFLAFQQGVRVLGSTVAGIFMYLLPPWGLFFAWFFLGEQIEHYHITATAMIMAGIIIATFPRKRQVASN